MATRTPLREVLSTQDGAPLDFSLQDGAASTQALSGQEPLLDGADAALWIGFGAVVSIFLIFIVAIIRARVIKPAERMARETDFFEPAGAHAEITFDHPAQSSDDRSAKKKNRDKKKRRDAKERGDLTELFPADTDETPPTENAPLEEVDAEPVSDADAEPAPDSQMAEIAAAIDIAAKEETAPSPFAGLFSRDDDAKQDEPAYDDADETIILADPYEEAAAPDDVRIDHLPEIDQHYWDGERERRETEEYEYAAQERRLALEAAAQARAAAEADRAEAQRMRRSADTALEQRMQAMAAMQGKLDAMADRLARDADGVETRVSAVLEKKFSALSDDLHQRLHTAAVDIDAQLQGASSKTSSDNTEANNDAAEAIGGHVAALQQTMESSLLSLAERIDALSAEQSAHQSHPEDLRRLNALLAERAAPAVAGTLQLGDLVRAALPTGRYVFDRELTSGANADCLITRPAAAPFAIDARFPAEAFDRYARADEKARDHAATSYRRAVLRHMIFVAEKLIIAGETADFAILFVPNDTIFSDLHQNFADVIQDSYRARIWIASPTSLMATLHMMNAASVTEDSTGKTNASDAVMDAVASLSARISALEDNLERVSTAPIEPARGEEPTTSDESAAAMFSQLEDLVSSDPSASSIDEDGEATVLETQEADIAIIRDDETERDNAEEEPIAPAEEERDQDDAGRPPFPLR